MPGKDRADEGKQKEGCKGNPLDMLSRGPGHTATDGHLQSQLTQGLECWDKHGSGS